MTEQPAFFDVLDRNQEYTADATRIPSNDTGTVIQLLGELMNRMADAKGENWKNDADATLYALGQHLRDVAARHKATQISYAGSTNLSSNNVEAALDELDAEKVASTHLSATDPHTQYQRESEKGAANGYASLDASGDVPVSQIPDSVLGTVRFQTTWNAATNTPDLNAATKEEGFYWRVSTAGSTNLSGITDWAIGDWVVWDGSVFTKIDNSESVTSVAGKSGAVTLTPQDASAIGTVLDEGAAELYSALIDFVGPGVSVDTYEATPGNASTRRVRVTVPGNFTREALFFELGNLTVRPGRGKYRVWENSRITRVSAVLNTAPSGSNATVTITRNGTVIHTLTILNGADAELDDGLNLALSAGDILKANITGVGSSVPGADLTVQVFIEP